MVGKSFRLRAQWLSGRAPAEYTGCPKFNNKQCNINIYNNKSNNNNTET